MTAQTLDLVGAAEIAVRLGVARDTVYKWTVRYPDFPAPAAVLRQGSVWEWSVVAEWAEGRSEG